MDQEFLKQARRMVRDRYGVILESKATDRMVLTLAAEQEVSFEAAAGPPPATIIEFLPDTQLQARVSAARKAVTESTAWDDVDEAMGDLRPESFDIRAMASKAVRQVATERTRMNFQQRSAAIRDVLQKADGPEAAESLSDTDLYEVCWLNETMRTLAPMTVLADVADAESVEQLDIGRTIEPDNLITTKLVGAPAFRSETEISGEGVIIAVIDSEIAAGHSAFSGRLTQKGNFTKESFGRPGKHGTAVAGLATSGDPGNLGVAPGATVFNYKVLAANRFLNADDFGGSLAIQQALEDGADVANCSWGAGAASDGTSREARTCDNAWALGLTLVKSAGNRGPSGQTLTTPADAEGIIVVGSCDSDGRRIEDYSSRGPTSDGRHRPHLVAPGGNEGTGLVSALVGGGIGNVGWGTSYAAPHVTGLVALLLAQSPGWSPDELRDELIRRSTELANFDLDAQGAGLVFLG